MAKKSKPEPEILEEAIETTEKEPYPELNEAKHNTFLRLAKPRTQKILKSLEILGNCSNKSSYAYYPHEVKKMINTIRDATDKIEALFSKNISEQKELFEF